MPSFSYIYYIVTSFPYLHRCCMHRFIVLQSVCSKSGCELDDWGVYFLLRARFFLSVTLSVQILESVLFSVQFVLYRVVSASET
jgi:hypothetical protein